MRRISIFGRFIRLCNSRGDFNALMAYSVTNGIRFTNIVGCTTDDAAATVRWRSGFDEVKGGMNSMAD